jgi:predicted ATPase/DNA-binding CsgD family transcriptional regulator
MSMTIHNLPQYSTPFVGRTAELAEISSRFNDSNCRLLTLVGPGGIGKTRLATKYAAQHAGQFANATYFVPFQSLGSSDLMVSTIADVMRFHFNPGRDPKQQLLRHLSKLEILLVLDNLEHLLDGVDLIPDILQVAPDVSILVTSRERLNLGEEWVFDVRGLEYPADDSETDIYSYDAVNLFLSHVRRINAPSDLNSIQYSTVVRICQLVGGMPLGIELAAAWTRTLSFAGIAQGIESSLDILETSVRGIERRHRAMRATLDPMWKRLSDAQRTVVRQLSIFRGGFTREAAEAVTGTSIHTLSSLVDRSFLHMDNRGRYDFHELLRQYAKEKLHESSDELHAVRKRHCRYFTAYLSRREKVLEGKGQKSALEEIQGEIDNIRAAWAWAVQEKWESEIGQACHALWFFYDTRSWYGEAAQSFGAAASALGMDRPIPPMNRTLGRVMAYYALHSTFSPDRTQEILENSLSMLRHLDARSDTGFVLVGLSEVALFWKNDPETALAYLQESLSIFSEVGNDWGAAYSLRWMGHASIYLGDYEEGQRFGEASLAIYEETGDTHGKAIALGVIGICALRFGQYDHATEISQEILSLCEAIGLRWHTAFPIILLGAAACHLGNFEEAGKYLHEGLKDAYEVPVVPTVLFGLLETVPWLIAMDHEIEAIEILAFLLVYPVPPIRGKLPVRDLFVKLKNELPDEDVSSATARSRTLTLEAVVDTCLGLLQQDATTPQSGRHPSDLLTARELDVLRLAAGGLTNPQIAEKLSLTVGTVKWYLHQIYMKLGVANRTQATTTARELNLLP